MGGDSHRASRLPSAIRSTVRIGSRKECGGFDLIERTVDGNIAARLVDPVAGLARAGQPHRFRKRLVDVAGAEPLARALVAGVGVGGGASGRMDFDHLAELAAEIAPPI